MNQPPATLWPLCYNTSVPFIATCYTGLCNVLCLFLKGFQWSGSMTRNFPRGLGVCEWHHIIVQAMPYELEHQSNWPRLQHTCGKITWLITMLFVSISNLASSWTKRSVSYRDRNSGMHTQTNVVSSGSLNWTFTSSITSCKYHLSTKSVPLLHDVYRHVRLPAWGVSVCTKSCTCC